MENKVFGAPLPRKGQYKVYIQSMTYNQAPYIVDNMNGVAMQQTDFPFAHVIYDDCSTDGEQDVIKEWLKNNCKFDEAIWYENDLAEIVEVKHKSNINLTNVVYFFKRNLYREPVVKRTQLTPWREVCPYVAQCEGDDYWIEPLKLQRQVTVLDSHPELDMCAHGEIKKYADSGKIYKYYRFKNQEGIITTKDVIIEEGGIVATASLLYRTKMYFTQPEFVKFMGYDYTLQIQGSLRGGIYFLPQYMSVYRYMTPGSYCAKLAEDNARKIKIEQKKFEMLDILDKETSFIYHKAILARKMLYKIIFDNSAKTNLKYFKEYRDGFSELSLGRKLSVLAKCYFPWLGRLVIGTLKLK